MIVSELAMALLTVIAAVAVVAWLYVRNRQLARANAELQAEFLVARQSHQERSLLERQLHQIERLDSLGLLAGGFAHDFNNLLVGVLGNAQLIAQNGELDSASREGVEQIRDSAVRAASLCRDLLSYAGRTPLETRAVDAAALLSGLAPVLRAGIGADNELALPARSGSACFQGDRAQIEQVLVNLVTNAREAIEGHGKIVVAAERVELVPAELLSGHWFGALEQARRFVRISVSDNGAGVEDAAIGRVFDPFFSARFPGRGLGLAATYGIVRRHDGLIHVASEVGRGTTVSVFLPQASDDALVDDVLPAESPVGRVSGSKRASAAATDARCRVAAPVGEHPDNFPSV